MKFTRTNITRTSTGRSREGAWIEIAPSMSDNGVGAVAPARERGLKYGRCKWYLRIYEVAPARERGLKSFPLKRYRLSRLVAPARERGLK